MRCSLRLGFGPLDGDDHVLRGDGAGVPGGAIACFAALSAIAGLPAEIMAVYISVNTLCDMGATCVNVLGDIACSVAMKETCKLDSKK